MIRGILKVFAVFVLVAALFGAFDGAGSSDGIASSGIGIIPSVSADGDGGNDGSCNDGGYGCMSDSSDDDE